MNYISCIEKRKLFNLGFVELWDFSKANRCQEAREEACALVSSVNYDREIKNHTKHFQRLLTENGGRASEVFEFIPAKGIFTNKIERSELINKLLRFGYISGKDFLSNFRAIYNYIGEEIFDKKFLCAKNFVVFKVKIPKFILMHLVRHDMISRFIGQNWCSQRHLNLQEYFENDEVKYCWETNDLDFDTKNPPRQELINKGTDGLKYVTGWFAGWLQDPMTWQNMFRVRGDKTGTQKEMRELVTEMKKLIEKYYGWDYAETEEQKTS